MPKIQLYTQKCIRQMFKCSMHVSNRKVIYKGDIDQRSMPKNIPTLAPEPLRIYTFFALNGAFCGLPGRGERLLRAKLFQGGAGARNQVQSRAEYHCTLLFSSALSQ